MNYGNAVSHLDILEARDRRQLKQKKILKQQSSSATLISFMVNMPSHYKQSPMAIKLHEMGDASLRSHLAQLGIPVLERRIDNEITGTEGYYSVLCDAKKLKSELISLEEIEPLARLWDFDVINDLGQPITREDLNLPKRQCLLCGNAAHVCSRSKAHTYEDLLRKISTLHDFETDSVQDK